MIWCKNLIHQGVPITILMVLVYSLPLVAGDNAEDCFKSIQSDFSADRSIQGNRHRVTINLADCRLDKRVFFGSMGSTLFAVVGAQGEQCQVKYVTEMEQGGWQWNKVRTCLIPRQLKQFVLPLQETLGLQTEALQDYCRHE